MNTSLGSALTSHPWQALIGLRWINRIIQQCVYRFSFQFSSGLWFVTQKFATKSSCLTYEFKTDDLGFKSIEQVPDTHLVVGSCDYFCILQVRQLPYSARVGLDHEYM